jgi:2-methylisocitrate lyase-like PEP mutase family enzyme
MEFDMDSSSQAKAQAFRWLHKANVLVLPNAWDAASAALIEAAGARAVATTSGGVAWSLGRPDGQGLTRGEMVGQVRRIVAPVDVPVTADIEGGYGPASDDVAATVSAIVEAGAVGINLEDSLSPGGPLFGVEEQADRLRAARRSANEAGLLDLFINARTDIFLFGVGAEAGRLDAVIERANAYREAGADCLFVPGLIDMDALRTLTAATSLPVNVMVWPGAPTVAELERVGVRRVSVGTALAQSAYSATQEAARHILESGDYDVLAESMDFGTLNSLFTH